MDLKDTDVTRYLCAAAYRDKQFREAVIKELIADEYKAIAVSPGVDLPTVVSHCLEAKNLEITRYF
jgi:hypothetical protein